MIHCIGDSHVSFFTGVNKYRPTTYPDPLDCIKGFRTYNLSPLTAYSFIDDRHRMIQDAKRVMRMIPKSDTIMYCFGEIDCRFRIVQKAIKNKTWIKYETDKLIEKYFDTISKLQEHGWKNFIIYCPAPTLYTKEEILDVHTGTYYQILLAKAWFSSIVLKRLPKNSISLFFDFYKNGYYKDATYYRDHIHLSQKAMPLFIRKLRKMGVLDVQQMERKERKTPNTAHQAIEL